MEGLVVTFNIREPFPATVQPRTGGMWRYHPSLVALRAAKASGVYAIIDARTLRVLYVGESHTGRLYDTITRHFRKWCCYRQTGNGRKRGEHGEGGKQYDRAAVLITFRTCPAAQAQAKQYEEIQRLNPRDNEVVGESVAPF